MVMRRQEDLTRLTVLVVLLLVAVCANIWLSVQSAVSTRQLLIRTLTEHAVERTAAVEQLSHIIKGDTPILADTIRR